MLPLDVMQQLRQTFVLRCLLVVRFDIILELKLMDGI